MYSIVLSSKLINNVIIIFTEFLSLVKWNLMIQELLDHNVVPFFGNQLHRQMGLDMYSFCLFFNSII